MSLAFLDFSVDFASDHVVSVYDELPLWSAMFGLLLLEEVPLAGARTALDVGCGTGFPLVELAERLGPRAFVHGVDPWSAALARAADKVAVRGVSNVELHEGSARAMPFADGTFDLIVSNLGLNNFENPAEVVRECRRVCRAGATLAITTNLVGHMKELYRIFEEVLRGSPDRLALLSSHVAHRGTVESVRALLEGGGFEVTRIVERSGSMRFADGDALFNHYFIKLGFLSAWKTIAAGDEHTILANLRDAMNALAMRDGEIRLTIPMAYFEAKAR